MAFLLGEDPVMAFLLGEESSDIMAVHFDQLAPTGLKHFFLWGN